MRSYKLYEHDGRYIGIIFPELFMMILGFWLFYVIFDWVQSPYTPISEKRLNITIIWDP
jgi:hypothetical protein